MAETGRNEPCPCGSGKKYKKCCGQGPAVIVVPEVQRALALHQQDQHLVDEMLRFAKKRWGPRWVDEAADAFLDDFEASPYEVQLLVPWSVYHFEKDGTTVVQLFRRERADRLSPDEHLWLEAQSQAWLSVWEVQEVQPGVGVRVRDLLTHQERFANEVKGSKTLKARDCVLGRVVDCGGMSTFCGMFPRSLPPSEADRAVRTAKRLCRVRTRPIAPAKLRDLEVELALVDMWHISIEEMDHRPPPQLANTDGDLLLLTADHFEFDAGRRAEVIARLEKLEGAQEAVDENGEADVTFLKAGNAKMKDWENTVIGRAIVTAGKLKLETNSVKRADALRSRVEEGLQGFVRRRARQHSDVEGLLANAPPGAPRLEETPPELKALVQQMKQQHMVRWLDEQIPALGGITPREAAQKPASRAKLDLLLRDFENNDAHRPPEERFDHQWVRAQLGLST